MISLKEILQQLKSGNFSAAYDNIEFINERVMEILNYPDDSIKNTSSLLDDLTNLIYIGNITYNYSDSDVLPIDDGIYDLLIAQLQRIDYNRCPVGAIPIDTINVNDKYSPKLDSDEPIKPFTRMTAEDMIKLEESFYPSILNMNRAFDPRANMEKPFIRLGVKDSYISKRVRTVSHNYPNLVGTLEKCKFVLDKQAIDLGVFEDSNVTVLERDFFVPLLNRGLIDYNTPIQMIGTLKYDGVSIEADVNTEIISARTRGDTDLNEASDLTPIFEGYKFPNARELSEPIGMKFEAIVLYDDLKKLNELYGTNYINGRTAIIGLLGSSDARALRDFITLVPLQCDFGPDVVKPDRVTEIQFLNKYYANREYLRWVVIEDTYTNLLFRIKKYVEEAEYFRAWSRFMYDGVVLEFTDPYLVNTLGRKNSINQYAMAVKFNPLKRITTFTGFTYTVGQNGAITPMIHYTPIEFLGSIHTKSTGSSYERFRDLNLFIGDKIEVTYVNDVMPYVNKLDIDANTQNHLREPNPEEMFPTHCPCCGTELVESARGKTMYCPNMNCEERQNQRLTNMLSKLGVKNFSQAAIETLGLYTLKDFMNCSTDDLAVLGPTNKVKFYEELHKLRTNPLPDYMVIGALGFTNIASKKWKLIFSNISLERLYMSYIQENANPDIFTIMSTSGVVYNSLEDFISNIKGVGPITAKTICEEFDFFIKDIDYIIANSLYRETPIGNSEEKYQIRFTGFRDKQLAEVLNKFPFIDCDGDAGITKKTTILLVPFKGHTSTKVTKALKYGVKVVDVKEFLEHPGLYIPEMDDVEI